VLCRILDANFGELSFQRLSGKSLERPEHPY
jgi:hypothetical protein